MNLKYVDPNGNLMDRQDEESLREWGVMSQAQIFMLVSLVYVIDIDRGNKCYIGSCVLLNEKEIILKMQFVFFLTLITASTIIKTGYDLWC